MLRTTMSTAGSRAAARFPLAIRLPLTQSSPLRSYAQRSFNATARRTTKPNRSANFAFTFSSHPRPMVKPSTLLQRIRNSTRFFNSSRARKNGKPTSPNPTPNLGSPKSASEGEPTTLGGRLRKLSREYGWSALGVYLALSASDFPFCYLLVRYLGTDRIGEWEHIIVSHVKAVVPDSVKQMWNDWRASMKKAERDMAGSNEIGEHVEMVGWGVEEASERNKIEASLATQLALAYAIHKSFIFIRVPLTAAVTPKVVKVLRGWGWDIGKRTTKEAKALKRAANPPKPKRR